VIAALDASPVVSEAGGAAPVPAVAAIDDAEQEADEPALSSRC
jgi:hypothetical protein